MTFEELREIGLSVTRSARLIAHREMRGGFASIDDLVGIPGLPKGSVTELQGKLRVL